MVEFYCLVRKTSTRLMKEQVTITLQSNGYVGNKISGTYKMIQEFWEKQNPYAGLRNDFFQFLRNWNTCFSYLLWPLDQCNNNNTTNIFYVPGTVLSILYSLGTSQGLFSLYTLETQRSQTIRDSKKSNNFSEVTHLADNKDSNLVF